MYFNNTGTNQDHYLSKQGTFLMLELITKKIVFHIIATNI